jgi:regulator of sirC expression with transglutaminase-like and TPR domain
MFEDEKIREITALLRLLDEPDEDIYTRVSDRLASIGPAALPYLENEWESMADAMVQQRIERLLLDIRFQVIKADFGLCLRDGCADLLQASLAVARIGDPELSEEDVHQEFARVRKDIWLEINDNLTALEQIRVFNHVFYDIHGFGGNPGDLHAPDNSLINRVLAERKGNPLSLAIVYMLVAQSLDIPVYGVNLPEHFVLAYVGAQGEEVEIGSRVLFYINAFSGGAVFSRKEVVEFIRRLGHEPQARFLEPCSNRDIIQRMLNNLLNAFFKAGDPERVEQVEELRKMLNAK